MFQIISQLLANQIIIRNRVNRRLHQLTSAINLSTPSRRASTRIIRALDMQGNADESESDTLLLHPHMIAPFTFPTYTRPTTIQVTTARGPVSTGTPHVSTNTLPFLELDVCLAL